MVRSPADTNRFLFSNHQFISRKTQESKQIPATCNYLREMFRLRKKNTKLGLREFPCRNVKLNVYWSSTKNGRSAKVFSSKLIINHQRNETNDLLNLSSVSRRKKFHLICSKNNNFEIFFFLSTTSTWDLGLSSTFISLL